MNLIHISFSWRDENIDFICHALWWHVLIQDTLRCKQQVHFHGTPILLTHPLFRALQSGGQVSHSNDRYVEVRCNNRQQGLCNKKLAVFDHKLRIFKAKNKILIFYAFWNQTKTSVTTDWMIRNTEPDVFSRQPLIYLLCATLYLNSTTFQRKILYFLLHYILFLKAKVTNYLCVWLVSRKLISNNSDSQLIICLFFKAKTWDQIIAKTIIWLKYLHVCLI